MPVNHLLPFALPHGRKGTAGQLTVYLSPRLKERGRLRDYPAWVDWPATLSGLTLEVRVNGAVAPHTQVGVRASSALWRAVFSRRTSVEPHRFVDFAKTPLLPMASSDFSEAILELYLSMARLHPDGPPAGADLLALATAAGLDLGVGDDPEDDSLAEAAAYRAPMEHGVDVDEPIEAPEFDFHASVSLLGHHPELLRHLGLAIDLEVQLPANPTQVIVTTGLSGGQSFEADLVTRTTRDFLSLPNPDPDLNEQAGGFLNLVAEKAFLSIVDPNQAATRLSATADLAAEQDEGVLPALSTRALTLVRPDMTRAYANRFVRQAELEAAVRANINAGGAPVVLFAEDMTIGHRIDVLDQGTWRSLFERKSDIGYNWPPAEELPTIVPKPDEGWNTTMLVTEQQDNRPEPNPDTDVPIQPTALFRLDDAMYRWNGWSGAAPPIGSVLDSATGEPKVVEPSVPAVDQLVQVTVDYQVVPGSLPRLRFGRTYQMRARCVDLAGNSQPLSAVEGKDAAALPEAFGRLEPIGAPVVVRRSPRPAPGVGDTPYEIVLRSDFDIDDADVDPVDRLLFPGRVGQDLVELHGQPEGGADPDSYADLARRDALDLTDQTVADPVTGEIVAGVESTGRIEPGATRQDVDYLSDPAIGGVRFGFPSLSEDATVSGLKPWPERQSFRLVVSAGDEPLQVKPDDETDVLVSVPKAEIVPVDASFSIDPANLDHFALWQRLSSAEQGLLKEQVQGGSHWMFTPPRPLTLVHAVRRPLLTPSVRALKGKRSLGSSAVTFTKSALVVHNNSTERVSLTASWTDLVDDLALDEPGPRSTQVELGSLLVSRGTKNEVAIESLTSELHDTKRHLATVDLEAFSSFAAYFTEEQTVTVGTRPVVLDALGVVSGMVEVTVPETGAKARLGADFTVDGPNGTISFVKRGALVPGSRAVVRYITLPISRVSTEPGQPKPFVILFKNTVPPPPPSIAEVIPAFARGDGAHSGQVLRVYLDRPWLVTGEGEELAVVIDPSGSTGTVLGRDPIVPGTGRTAELTTADFPRAKTVIPSLDGLVAIVGHEVSFDADSGRWYSDIELGAGFGYRPFLRLTLCRFQPDSISGATLSAFVTVDPVRLGVVRQSTVERSGDTVDIKITGVDELGNQMQARVETADKTIVDPDLRWQPVGAPIRLVRTGAGDDTTWSGTLDLTGTVDPLRVVVEELEPGRRDDSGVPVAVETAVFIDVFELDPA